jgi:hypothetical protein
MISSAKPIDIAKQVMGIAALNPCYGLQLISASIECPMTRVGQHGYFVLHLDEAYFDQGPEIIRTDRQEFGSLAFDVTQRPAEPYRRA